MTINIKYPLLSDKEWLAEQIKTRPMRDIAKEVGSSYGAVIHAVRKFELTVPWKPQRRPANMQMILKEALHAKYPEGRFGQDAARWKGGRKQHYGKYVGIFVPDHPNCSADGYVCEHRLIMEQKLGRYLTREEVVHHKNGNKHDNRIENLELMPSRKHHAREHFDAVREVERLRQERDAALDANMRTSEQVRYLLEAVKALLANANHLLPIEWRRDRPVSLAKAAIAKTGQNGHVPS